MRLPSTSRSADASARDGTPTDPPLPALTRWLRPAVDAVARIRLTVHQKLLAGFLTGALLLVGMATLSLVVIGQMHQRVSVLETQANKVDLARQMLYDVTAQSHYRAMALLRYKKTRRKLRLERQGGCEEGGLHRSAERRWRRWIRSTRSSTKH